MVLTTTASGTSLMQAGALVWGGSVRGPTRPTTSTPLTPCNGTTPMSAHPLRQRRLLRHGLRLVRSRSVPWRLPVADNDPTTTGLLFIAMGDWDDTDNLTSTRYRVEFIAMGSWDDTDDWFGRRWLAPSLGLWIRWLPWKLDEDSFDWYSPDQLRRDLQE